MKHLEASKLIGQQEASVAGNTDITLATRRSDEFEFCIIGPEHPRRAETERFIRERFAAVHGARINTFMSQLIALTDAEGVIKSAIGIRDAGNTRLFLEYYLDVSVEEAIAYHADQNQQQTAREQIVEVGNLASADRHASRRLFEFLTLYLIESGYQWAVFTGCNSLRYVFKRMQLKLYSLGNADQSRLPRELGSWGRYYDNNPQVMAGPILGGLALAQKSCTGMHRVRT
jgi:hypothetical protein